MPDQNVQHALRQVSELKVSGHTMALDPGLYCMFSAPGSTAPAGDTGLPIVRISGAPGHGAGRVEVVGLDSEGWIGPDAATLVRVADARSNVLVTVYQDKDTRAEAPQLQVVKISGQAEAATQAPAPSASTEPARVAHDARTQDLLAHIYGRGDVGGTIGEWVGEPGSKRWIEGFSVAPMRGVPASDIEYQAVLGRGWLSPWSEGGQFCGSRSMSLPILGLRVRLRGDSASTHKVVLSATFVDGTEIGPVHDGDSCEAPSLAALEAFQLAIEWNGASARTAGTAVAAKPVRRTAAKREPEPAKPANRTASAKTKLQPVTKTKLQPVTKNKVEADLPAPPAKKAGKAPPAAPAPAAAKRATSKVLPSRTPASTRRR